MKRYVVPDAKASVTYTMTPNTGYTLEKVVVDGTTYTVPDTPEASATIASSDGNGTLKYLGGGKFTYSFDQANTQDHEIYVTWKKATADIKVSKVWNDASKAAAANVKLVSDAGFDDSQAIPQTSDDVHTWTKMPIYNYDANGDATTAITYTLSEVDDPVSNDYMKASWSGKDKEDRTADGGFALTDPSKENKCREPDDVFQATVTNTLKKDVEITKTWDDQNDKYGLRPSDVAGMFTLYTDAAASTAAVDPPTPTQSGSGNSITVKWSGVPAFDSNGDPITYYAKETVPTGYTADPDTGIVAAGGTITNTLQDPPIGKDATSKGGKGQSQTGTPVFEKGTADIPSTGAYTLLDKSGNPTDSVTVPGEGKYTINKDTGEVTFEPEPDFTGTASGVTVQVTDADGLTGTANYKPTVVNTTEEKTIKRVIKYTYQTKDGKIAHKEVVQELPAKREGTYDPDNPKADKNGIVWTDNWTFPNGKTFPAVKNPSISGWKTDDVAEAYTISGADDKPPTVYIVYQKDKKKSGSGSSSSGSSAAPAAPAAQPIVTPIPGEQPVTPPPASPGPAAQATGDSSRMALWGGIGIAAILAFAALLLKRRR
ncbi:MAG: Cna B-type domain-containing protein [Lachnospiraceae bacterium]|nr:Cna B-type domain-containing protein [Lachnospiraceae bacterium]